MENLDNLDNLDKLANDHTEETMNKAAEIKERINLRDFIQRDLGKPKTASANYDLYQCPLHHESRGYSFAVYEDHWTCFGKCNTSGDVFSWLERYQGMSFQEALAYLGGAAQKQSAPRRTENRRSEPDEPPGDEWQFYAAILVSAAEKVLWSDEGKRALAYLRGRGLLESTIEEAHLGYLPGNPDQWLHPIPEWKKTDGKTVPVPCGITIPHFADDSLWAVRVRRSAGSIKYQGIPGGSKALYWSDNILGGMPILITEGEFDCLLADQWGCHVLCTVSLASASNKHINRRWWTKLVAAPQILVRCDNDDAGKSAAAQLSQLSSAVRIVQVPETKDITDYYKLRGPSAVMDWLRGLI